ncbi:MAG TPA: hypothetical protein VIJ75_05350, partial [Hanamia sp.]
YTLIISDLTDAASKLPDVAAAQGRATKGAAYALLGRVQMQKGDYAEYPAPHGYQVGINVNF